MTRIAQEENDKMINILDGRLVNILIIGNTTIRKQLDSKFRSLRLWNCIDLEEAEDFTLMKSHQINLVIYDLTQFSGYDPKDSFLKIKSKMQDIPILVITDQTDHDLTAFVMNKGAADSISEWHVQNNPEGLVDVIKACIIRGELSKETIRQSEENFLDSKERYKGLLKATGKRRLQSDKAREADKSDLKRLEKENASLREENAMLLKTQKSSVEDRHE